jgi:hypothetical protein
MGHATERRIIFSATASRNGTGAHVGQFIRRCLAFGVFLLAADKIAYGQLVVTTNNGASVSQGSSLRITASPVMPQLNLWVSGGAIYCDSMSYTLSINWTAPTGQQTMTSLNGDFACNQTANVNWGSQFAGGTATLQWNSYATCADNSGGFSFQILGTNPPPSAVRSLISSPPWFWWNMVAYESGAWTASPTGMYHQFASTGVPINCNCPNGIGLGQLEPPYPSGNLDFWAWPDNEVDSYNLLVRKQSLAYSNWNNELSDMIANNGGHPIWPTYLKGACNFSATAPSGAPASGTHSFGDADWMHSYNSNYFIFWNPPTQPNGTGAWDMDLVNTKGNPAYVPSVCSSPAI